MLLRLAYLGVTNAFALLRLLPMSDRDKDAEILALRHLLVVLQQQLGTNRVRFTPSDRALLAALLHYLPRRVLGHLHLVVRPDAVLRWHRDLIARRHAERSRPKRVGRPRTVRSMRALVLRLVHENPSWGCRRVHGELLVLGVKVAASTVWEIQRDAGIDPAPERSATTWATFLCSQAEALLACDFFETVTLSGARLYVFAMIEHAGRQIRVLGATAHPTAAWVTQAVRNLVMDLQDAGTRARFLIRDRDGKYPGLFDAVLTDAGIQVVLSGVRMPRMNSIMEPWVQTCRRELAGSHPDLEPGSPATCSTRVRALLQRPPTAPGHRERSTTPHATRAAHRSWPNRVSRRTKARSTGRHPARIQTYRVTCTDEVFGKGKECIAIAA